MNKLEKKKNKLDKSAVNSSQKETDAQNEQKAKKRKLQNRVVSLFCLSFFVTFVVCASTFALYHFSSGQNSSDTTKKMQAIQQLVDDGKYDTAITQYLKIIKKDSSNISARIALAKTYALSGDLEQAKTFLQQSISLFSNESKLYKAMVGILVSANKPQEALEFINSIEVSGVKKSVRDSMPLTPSCTPSSGSFDKSIEVTLTSANETDIIYYSLDGELPDITEENKYISPITVSDGKIVIRAFAINSEGYISTELKSVYTVYNTAKEHKFADAAVEDMVRAELKKQSGKITVGDLSRVLKLNSLNTNKSITSLDDLSLMPNITSLTIASQTSVISYAPLLDLVSLKDLSVSACAINDSVLEVIGQIPTLQSLDISGNQITSLNNIKLLYNLTSLNAANNILTDVSPLKYIDKLTKLNISGNKLTMVTAVSSLTSLTSLDISNNTIVSIQPLKSLTSLTWLNISTTTTTDIADLASLKKLTYLSAANNSIINLSSLSQMYSLKELDLSSNSISDVSSLNMLSITTLNVSDNQILSFNIDLPFVKTLYIKNNILTEVAQLQYYSNLSVLYINNNDITDISPLATSSSLQSIYCAGNPIESTSMFPSYIKVYK